LVATIFFSRERYADDETNIILLLKPHGQNSSNFGARFYAVARSSCGGVAIRYVLPVLWMTSYFQTVALVAGDVCSYTEIDYN